MTQTTIFFTLFLLISMPAKAETLFIQREGGTISLIQNLTHHECVSALKKVQDGMPSIRASRQIDTCRKNNEKNKTEFNCSIAWITNNNDIKEAECLK